MEPSKIRLFQKTVFEEERARYKTTSSFDKHIHEELEKLYPDIMNKKIKFKKNNSIEINSKNFLIECKEKKYNLKLQTKNINSYCQKKILFTQMINKEIIIFPETIKNINNEYVSTLDENTEMILSKYIPNSYYPTKDYNYKKFKFTMQHLVEQAKSKNLEKLLNISTQNKQLKKVGNIFSELYTIGVENILPDNQELMEILENFERYVMELIDQMQNLEMPDINTVSHYDLHPLNMLDGSDRIYLLDIDSLSIGPAYLAYAYATFRIKRKLKLMGVNYLNEELIIKDSFDDYTLQLRKSEIKLYCQYELSRRISLVIDMLICKGSSKWIKVMPSLINAVYESEVLFK